MPSSKSKPHTAKPSPSKQTSASTSALPAVPSQPEKIPATLSLLQHLTVHPISDGADRGTSSTSSIQEIHSSQIAHRSLHLRRSSPDPNSQDARGIRRKKRLSFTHKQRSKARPKPLSAREKRVLGVYDLELTAAGRTKTDWNVWKGLWGLWCGYAWEVFGLGLNAGSNGSRGLPQEGGQRVNLSPAHLGPKVTSLDLHGALLRVVKAQNPSLVGVWGVCVRENKFSVVLVDQRCVVRRVGKRGVVFAMEVPLPVALAEEEGNGGADGEAKRQDAGGAFDSVRQVQNIDVERFLRGEEEKMVFEISGKAIECRPIDRATKKFKGRKYDGL